MPIPHDVLKNPYLPRYLKNHLFIHNRVISILEGYRKLVWLAYNNLQGIEVTEDGRLIYDDDNSSFMYTINKETTKKLTDLIKEVIGLNHNGEITS